MESSRGISEVCFKRKALAAQVRLCKPARTVGANQALQIFSWLTSNSGLQALGDPAAAFGFRQVLELRADGAA